MMRGKKFLCVWIPRLQILPYVTCIIHPKDALSNRRWDWVNKPRNHHIVASLPSCMKRMIRGISLDWSINKLSFIFRTTAKQSINHVTLLNKANAKSQHTLPSVKTISRCLDFSHAWTNHRFTIRTARLNVYLLSLIAPIISKLWDIFYNKTLMSKHNMVSIFILAIFVWNGHFTISDYVIHLLTLHFVICCFSRWQAWRPRKEDLSSPV